MMNGAKIQNDLSTKEKPKAEFFFMSNVFHFFGGLIKLFSFSAPDKSAKTLSM